MNRPVRTRISKGGQISVPAPIRHRWGVDEVLLEDRGDEVALRPMPRDPIAAARGALGRSNLSVDRVMSEERLADLAAEDRKYGHIAPASDRRRKRA